LEELSMAILGMVVALKTFDSEDAGTVSRCG
jgi:hypothetical protein